MILQTEFVFTVNNQRVFAHDFFVLELIRVHLEKRGRERMATAAKKAPAKKAPAKKAAAKKAPAKKVASKKK